MGHTTKPDRSIRAWWSRVKDLPAPRLDEAYSGGWMGQDYKGMVRIDFTKRRR